MRALLVVLPEQFSKMGRAKPVLAGERVEVQLFITMQLNLLHGVFHGLCVMAVNRLFWILLIYQMSDQLANQSGNHQVGCLGSIHFQNDSLQDFGDGC